MLIFDCIKIGSRYLTIQKIILRWLLQYLEWILLRGNLEGNAVSMMSSNEKSFYTCLLDEGNPLILCPIWERKTRKQTMCLKGLWQISVQRRPWKIQHISYLTLKNYLTIKKHFEISQILCTSTMYIWFKLGFARGVYVLKTKEENVP